MARKFTLIQSLWSKWTKKRFSFEQHKRLTQKDVLVFMYQQGYLYLVLILITFIAGVNYANNLILGFCFLISAILCISFYITFKQLHGLHIEVSYTELGQVGQPLSLELYFKQPQAQARYLWIKVDAQMHQIMFADLRYCHTVELNPNKRGVFEYPTVQLFSVYPFGLVRAWTYMYLKRQSWIAPHAQYSVTQQQRLRQAQELDLDEFRELRDFRQGDSIQTVSWKQVARGQGLYVKVFEQHDNLHSVEIDYLHMPSTDHEEKLSLMMGLIEQCEQQQYAYRLLLPHAELANGVGEQQMLQAKRLLAQA
ncbi:DUF58 domain-containing protein [Acinetobacter sp. ANC 4173]|uniref:DUF58 domain-containing protein n=1 Tax=Acinetobacter sp. ANC 4173 TaxID=2529837 RepID=UPI00103D1402|nr:DUF58 domain-containing protein [Acinetobacter sp. ANC 4173]TCB81678.1 DUF58 domain-containing protein [Acinetobacter sp. ANC 4173]